MTAQAATMVAGGMSGTLQDLLKKRPTEVEFFNGYIARQAEQHGTRRRRTPSWLISSAQWSVANRQSIRQPWHELRRLRRPDSVSPN